MRLARNTTPVSGHPECAARLTAILNALGTVPFAALEWRDRLRPRASNSPVSTAKATSNVFSAGFPNRNITPSTGTPSFRRAREAALRAAGAVCAAVDAVLRQEADNAFCAIRPPGHHAEPAQAMGFACSTMPPSAPPTPAPFTIWNGWR